MISKINRDSPLFTVLLIQAWAFVVICIPPEALLVGGEWEFSIRFGNSRAYKTFATSESRAIGRHDCPLVTILSGFRIGILRAIFQIFEITRSELTIQKLSTSSTVKEIVSTFYKLIEVCRGLDN